jgi:hypothetical protein
MTTKILQKTWLAFVTLLAAFCVIIACVFARNAVWGFPGASGDPTGIGMARLGAGLISIFLFIIAALFVFVLVRGIKRVLHDRHG